MASPPHKVAAVLIACMFAATATAHATTYRIAIVPITDQPKLLRAHVEFGQPADPPSTSSATPLPRMQGAPPPELPPQHGHIGDRKKFWVVYYDATHPGGPSPWVSVNATLEYSTEHTDLWEDDDIDGQQDARFESASRKAEESYLSQHGRFGSLSYTEADRSRHPCIVPSRGELLSILVVKAGKVKDGYAGTESYFSAAPRCAAKAQHTNELPGLLIVALQDGTDDPKDNLLTIGPAHEEQHLKSFVRHSIRGTTTARSSMLNEGLSVLAQDFASEQIFGRRDVDLAALLEKEYLADPNLVSLPAFYYFRGQESHPSGTACYGGAYLLQRYLYDRFGDSYLDRVTDTEADGFTAIAAALPIPLPDALRFGGYVLGLKKRSDLRSITDADFAVVGGSVSLFESASPISDVHVTGAPAVWTEQMVP